MGISERISESSVFQKIHPILGTLTNCVQNSAIYSTIMMFLGYSRILALAIIWEEVLWDHLLDIGQYYPPDGVRLIVVYP